MNKATRLVLAKQRRLVRLQADLQRVGEGILEIHEKLVPGSLTNSIRQEVNELWSLRDQLGLNK